MDNLAIRLDACAKRQYSAALVLDAKFRSQTVNFVHVGTWQVGTELVASCEGVAAGLASVCCRG